MTCSLLALPLAGWGTAYVFAIGLWLCAAALVLAVVLLIAVMVFRMRFQRWYFGTTDPDDPSR
jgi:hypothetical protein